MGRYYNGDIQGKFWFAIQSSDAPERFSAIEREQSYIDYFIERDSLPEIIKEIEKIESDPKVQLIMKLCDESDTISISNEWQEENGITREDLAEYADLTLGRKIRDFFEGNPLNEWCEIQADL